MTGRSSLVDFGRPDYDRSVERDSQRVVVSTSGRMQKTARRVDVRVFACRGGAVETVVEYYEGLRFLGARKVFAGSGPVHALFACRVFNDTVASLKREGFRGLKRIADVDPHLLSEAFLYISHTGNQPRFDENFELQLTDDEIAQEVFSYQLRDLPETEAGLADH